MKLRFPNLAYNWTTILGTILAVVGLVTVSILFGIAFTTEEAGNPYFGAFLYLLGPPVVIFGLVLIPVGMYRRWKQWQRDGRSSQPSWPVLDLNRPRHRNALTFFVVGTIVFGAVSAIGSYSTYHYSESVEFCGQACHVMEPEFTTYQHSPHARVACVDCHVGTGADWYVRSKLAGAHQLWSTLRDEYPRPIPTPVANMRPAQDTCEQCHWPQKVYGGQQRQFDHYLYDEESSHWPIDLLLKTGSGNPTSGQASGIHWHMSLGSRTEYIARDERRQDIPWVRVTDLATGDSTVYQSTDEPLTEDEIAAAVPRVMNCMDCHNRPSHRFRSPDTAIDFEILQGTIDPSIPAIKRIAVEAMSGEYATQAEARAGIARAISEAIENEGPALATGHQNRIQQAIAATQDAYAKNIFPEMKARWSEYPDNSGHFESSGCMRCHGGLHESESGVTLTNDCNACHTILQQGAGDRLEVASTPEGLDFVHPEDIAEMWMEVGCFECHGGTQP